MKQQTAPTLNNHSADTVGTPSRWPVIEVLPCGCQNPTHVFAQPWVASHNNCEPLCWILCMPSAWSMRKCSNNLCVRPCRAVSLVKPVKGGRPSLIISQRMRSAIMSPLQPSTSSENMTSTCSFAGPLARSHQLHCQWQVHYEANVSEPALFNKRCKMFAVSRMRT